MKPYLLTVTINNENYEFTAIYHNVLPSGALEVMVSEDDYHIFAHGTWTEVTRCTKEG